MMQWVVRIGRPARAFAAWSLALTAGCALAQQAPDQLLQSISDALNNTNYRGTLIQSVDGRINTMHVMHSNTDGVVREKLLAMDGEGREIVRTGAELVCLFPRSRLKLIETNAMPSNAFVRLPASAGELSQFYALEEKGVERIAGRQAVQYFLRPMDRFRYGHRLWVDQETLLPLRMQLVSRTRIIEETRFTDIEIGVEIPPELFVSSIDSEGFRVIRASDAPGPAIPISAKSGAGDAATAARKWPQEPYPGFKLRATETRTVSINGQVTRRLVFSDGIASVSVFIAARPAGDEDEATRLSRLGAAHSLQRRIGNNTVTLVGEVPAETLRMLAAGAEQQLGPSSAADGR